ncbi:MULTISPECIES: triphosphoribosyl-dephospho-CoA synthase CitG [Clostridium]|uniref:triphosphoribosyl-dephospho-CoA synthase CitG n=1 Tax=Clostridium TaxID=1485 RepID=UPI000824DE0E|nr:MULTISPECIES: triphosphoribosyl-dephospho-CoA synthase CitG [Clostridium]PJI08526.1 triphosphoribosyl-dephospho-CoA synthase CitG [Clostridium sp. CT7]
MKNGEYIEKIACKVGSLAIQAMLYEVSCFPSPGLVSPISNGAHKDMNFYTFIDSTCALSSYFAKFVREGFKDVSCKQLFKNIRKIGIEAEKDMFLKTNGVNTHKGMIFLMGIACAAVGKVINDNKTFKEVKQTIIEMTSGIVKNELENINPNKKMTYGEKIYLDYKIKGVKGEVEAGMPIIFEFSLDFFDECSDLNINSRLVHTLIGIMQVCEDTNIIHRHSIDVLREVQGKAKNVIQAGGMRSDNGREMIDRLSDEFIEKNISPGGSADILGVTVFMTLVKNTWNLFDY